MWLCVALRSPPVQEIKEYHLAARSCTRSQICGTTIQTSFRTAAFSSTFLTKNDRLTRLYAPWWSLVPRTKRHIEPMVVYSWADVEDVGPTIYLHLVSRSCCVVMVVRRARDMHIASTRLGGLITCRFQ